jgi:hypothetical protein
MKKIITAFLLSSITAIQAQSFNGTFSSEGDVQAKGIMAIDLSQTSHKIEGTATYTDNATGSSSGVLSVNGYVEGRTAYVRFRDQRGNTVGDGSINFTDNKTIYFKRTGGSSFVPANSYMYKSGDVNIGYTPVPDRTSYSNKGGNFGGNYNNQADVYRSGSLSMEIQQSGNHLSGTLHYSSYDGSINTGLWSVDGQVKDGMANVTLYDGNGRRVGSAILSKGSDGYHLIQNSPYSDWLPVDNMINK